jgi:hypothetical protein
MLKNTAMKVVCAGFFCVFTSQISYGAESEYLHQPRISARVMGMGGAFTALADDYNALYYNPGALARIEKSEFNFQIDAGLTPTVVNFYNNISAAGSNVSSMTQLLQNNYGQHYSARAGVGATYVKPGFGIGIQPVDLTAEMDINANAGAAVGLEAWQDSLIQFGLAWNAFKKSLSFGIAPKVVYRAFIEKEVLALDLATNNSLLKASDASEGITFDADIGVIYTLPVPEKWFAKPTVAVVVRNVVDEGFNTNLHLYNANSSSITNPDGYMGRRLDIGTRFELPEFWAFKPRVMADARDLGSRYASVSKVLHFGAELPWKVTESILGAYRVGLSEGYLTAGLSFYLSVFEFDIATYSEEIGTAQAPNQSRRYLAQFSFDF